jgi:hypothetical protein
MTPHYVIYAISRQAPGSRMLGVPPSTEETAVRRFLIERDIPAIGDLKGEPLRAGAQKSNDVLRELATEVQWVQSYVTGDKLFCVYLAKNEAVIQEHARRSGFPAHRITEVKRVIDPTTANAS